MKRLNTTVAIMLVLGLVAMPFPAMSKAPGARLLPQGSVSLLENGKEVTRFQSEAPLPDGLLMVGEGNCVVQSSGLQLVVQEDTVFALAEGEQGWELTVREGRVDFAMRPDAKPVTFRTPHDVIQSQQALVSAKTEGLIRGYLAVTEQTTELAVTDGKLAVTGSSSGGSQIIQPGHGIRLAIANPPGVAEAEKPEKKKKKAGGFFMLGGGTSWVPFALTAGGVVGVGVGAGLAASEGGGGKELSPP